MTGRVVHFEVPYDDADRARAFYSDVFGWAIQPMPEFDYNFVQTGPTADTGMPTETGYIGGGMFQRQDDIGRPIITIERAVRSAGTPRMRLASACCASSRSASAPVITRS